MFNIFIVLSFHPNWSEWVSTLLSQTLMTIHYLCEHVEPVGSYRPPAPPNKVQGVVFREDSGSVNVKKGMLHHKGVPGPTC